MKAPTMLDGKMIKDIDFVRSTKTGVNVVINSQDTASMWSHLNPPTGYDETRLLGFSVDANGVVPTGIGSGWAINLSNSTKTVTVVNGEYLCWNYA